VCGGLNTVHCNVQRMPAIIHLLAGCGNDPQGKAGESSRSSSSNTQPAHHHKEPLVNGEALAAIQSGLADTAGDLLASDVSKVRYHSRGGGSDSRAEGSSCICSRRARGSTEVIGCVGGKALAAMASGLTGMVGDLLAVEGAKVSRRGFNLEM